MSVVSIEAFFKRLKMIESALVIQKQMRYHFIKRNELILRIKNSNLDDSKDEFIELVEIADEVLKSKSVFIKNNVEFTYIFLQRANDAMSYKINSRSYRIKCMYLMHVYEEAFPLHICFKEKYIINTTTLMDYF